MPKGSEGGSSDATRFLARPPAWVLALALFAALLHLAPSLRALSQARANEGWTFTGNLSTSPDYMQYRVWERRTQVTGPLVDNRFTAEPSPPHLPVVYYWLVGQTSRATGAEPEWVNSTFGAAMAFALVLLVHFACRLFLGDTRTAGWVLLAIVLAGGLGAWLKLLNESGLAPPESVLHHLVASLDDAPVLENSRYSYVVKTLFDAHFLAIWLATTAAVLALYLALVRPTAARLAALVLLSGGATLLHVYEGPLLIAIAVLVAAACGAKRLARGAAWKACGLAALSAAASMVLQAWLYARSGLPRPTWQPGDVFLSNVLLAYPLAWIPIAVGLAGWWRRGGLEACFLAGWTLGCAAITLSSPYYPYADRGTMTWSIPLHVIAGSIWFARSGRLSLPAAACALLLAGLTPLAEASFRWKNAWFKTDQPAKFLGPDHRVVLDALRARAGEDDVLLADSYLEYRWLAPAHPGRSFHGHFFLTVRFEERMAAVQRFLHAAGREERERFLEENGVRFLFVASDRDPEQFEALSGLEVIARTSVGTLFEHTPRAGGSSG